MGPTAALARALPKGVTVPLDFDAVEVPFPNMGDQLKAGNVDAVEIRYTVQNGDNDSDGIASASPITRSR